MRPEEWVRSRSRSQKPKGGIVTGVDGTTKLPVLRSLGADHVIDYTEQDFTSGDVRYDLVFDIPGNRSFAEIRRVIAPGGHYVLIGHDGYRTTQARWLGSLPSMFVLTARSFFTDELPNPSIPMRSKAESLSVLRELLETGALTPVIDRAYPLEATAEAMQYLESGAARGKVMIAVVSG